jgi:hypothetical protein
MRLVNWRATERNVFRCDGRMKRCSLRIAVGCQTPHPGKHRKLVKVQLSSGGTFSPISTPTSGILSVSSVKRGLPGTLADAREPGLRPRCRTPNSAALDTATGLAVRRRRFVADGSSKALSREVVGELIRRQGEVVKSVRLPTRHRLDILSFSWL